MLNHKQRGRGGGGIGNAVVVPNRAAEFDKAPSELLPSLGHLRRHCGERSKNISKKKAKGSERKKNSSNGKIILMTIITITIIIIIMTNTFSGEQAE